MNTELQLKRQATGMLIGLAIQYFLGMAINMYIQFPDSATEGQLWEFAWKQPAVAAHIVLAILLFIGTVTLAIRAQKSQSFAWKVPAWIGFLAVLLAGFSGSRFIPTQSDPYSYLMAVCFLIAFFSYGWGLFRAKK